MPRQNNNNNTDNSNDSVLTINKEAAAKYGINLREPPTEPVEPYSRYKFDDTVYGFVTEVSHDQKGTEVEIKDWGYCLEDNTIELGFQNMLRSKIMEEVIKSYGLNPIVDLTGLRDDIISWNNGTSTDSGTGAGGTLSGEGTGSEVIDEVVRNAIGSETDELKKAQLIDEAFKSHVFYSKYYNCKFSDIGKAWEHAHLNCADGANILCAMFIAGGLKSTIVHIPGHYIVKVVINGKNYFTDNAAAEGKHTTRHFGETWGGTTKGSDVGTKIS